MKAYARDYARAAINQTQLEWQKLAAMDLMGEKNEAVLTVQKIYDYNGCLVKLLIASHQINPVFTLFSQNDNDNNNDEEIKETIQV